MCVCMFEWTKYDCFNKSSEVEVKRLSGDLPLAGQGNWCVLYELDTCMSCDVL